MNQIQANIRVLSDDEIVRIHNTSMRILSEIGLHVPNETVCGMAQKLGVKVDGETVRKISGNVSTQIFVFDEQTGTRRQGIVGADQGFSFAQLVLDDAWLDAFNYTLQGFTVDEDTMGFETIEEVVIDGALCAMLDKIVQDALDHLDA